MLIYCLAFPNRKLYIGQTNNLFNRIRFYKQLNCKKQVGLYKALNKYGWENITIHILKENLTQEDANKEEILYIKNFETLINQNGYNISSGGNAVGMTEYIKNKISSTRILRQIRHTSEVCRRIAEKNKGRKHTMDEKLKRSRSLQKVTMVKDHATGIESYFISKKEAAAFVGLRKNHACRYFTGKLYKQRYSFSYTA